MTIEQWPEAPGPLYSGLDLVRNQALRNRDTADEREYVHELWADADASQEGDGL